MAGKKGNLNSDVNTDGSPKIPATGGEPQAQAATGQSAAPATQTPEEVAKAKELAAIMGYLGTAKYSHEVGNITLYADRNDPKKKNGRAGHVVFNAGAWSIPCSVYMDVEIVSENGMDRPRRSYRISWPKGIKPAFAADGAVPEKLFKKLHLQAWGDARTAKQTTSDASGDDAGLVEYDDPITPAKPQAPATA